MKYSSYCFFIHTLLFKNVLKHWSVPELVIKFISNILYIVGLNKYQLNLIIHGIVSDFLDDHIHKDYKNDSDSPVYCGRIGYLSSCLLILRYMSSELYKSIIHIDLSMYLFLSSTFVLPSLYLLHFPYFTKLFILLLGLVQWAVY